MLFNLGDKIFSVFDWLVMYYNEAHKVPQIISWIPKIHTIIYTIHLNYTERVSAVKTVQYNRVLTKNWI